MLRQVYAAIVVFLGLSAVTGIAYPLFVTGVAQLVFPCQANGSLIFRDGKVIGSELIGQEFTDTKYLWGRPSATNPPYDSSASSGSNLSPTNPALLKLIEDRAVALRNAHPDQSGPVPIDLVTASASGLDPHISPAAAAYQTQRIADARNIDRAEVQKIIDMNTQLPTLGVLGEPRVNVLKANIALDQLNN